MKSAFESWFVAQHGKRPSATETWRLRNARDNAEAEYLNAQDMLRSAEEYDARKESALYAWQAREGK